MGYHALNTRVLGFFCNSQRASLEPIPEIGHLAWPAPGFPCATKRFLPVPKHNLFQQNPNYDV